MNVGNENVGGDHVRRAHPKGKERDKVKIIVNLIFTISFLTFWWSPTSFLILGPRMKEGNRVSFKPKKTVSFLGLKAYSNSHPHSR